MTNHEVTGAIAPPPASPPASSMPSTVVSDTRRTYTESEACIAAIVLLTILGLVLRLTFFNGPVGSDDSRYYLSAQMIVHGGRITVLDHATSRLALLLLVGAPAALAGSIFVAGLVNVVVSVVTQLVASVFAFRQIGPRAGVVVAVVLAFDGLALTYSGMFMPDNPLALFTLVCGILLYRADGATMRSALVSFLLAGAAAGAAYSTKDTGILLLVPAIVWALWQTDRPLRDRLALCVAFTAGFVPVWVMEGLFFLARAGDFLYKPHALATAHNAGIKPSHGLIEFARRGWWNVAEVHRSVWLTAVPLVVGIICWVRLLLPRRRTTVFALIGGFVAAYLFVGTSSFSRLVNLPYQERYFIPVIPCVAIALADVLERWRGGPRASWLAALAVACFVGGVVGAGARSGRLYFTEGMRNAAIAVNALPDDGRPVLAAAQIRWGVIHYLTPLAARRVHDATDYPKGTPGYYLTVLRDGAPAIADSLEPKVLGAAYLSVAVDQRRKRLWSMDGAHARDSAVVYIMGAR
jgi:4-amino-4-deoxy-L-arabinose transferase-like glycosyltransferase